METLNYVELARTQHTRKPSDFPTSVSATIVTNFTDDVLKKILAGMCLAEGIYPSITALPYKQYHFALKNSASDLYTKESDITFILFDLNPYLESEFASAEHFAEVMADVELFAKQCTGIVIIGSFLYPYEGCYGLKGREGRLWSLIEEYNRTLTALAQRYRNVYVFDTNALVSDLEFAQYRNLRNLYAYDMPFADSLTSRICAKWLSYIRARTGRTKKCIVLDLDNVLWGGVVGEEGPQGIAIGPDYPGNAYRSFQQALLDLYNRGVILAVNSKNNLSDVKEVFAHNKHMILREHHFAAMRINWENKTDNIRAIAKELNIDPSSMVFIDDDPVNRDVVRTFVPEVLVPEFSLSPEEYTRALFSLDVFDPLSASAEDKERNAMYMAEKQRKEVMSQTRDIEEYIQKLNISMRITCNDHEAIPRISQMTLKTNQFNLTTKRYTEHDIEMLLEKGARIYTGEVEDRFGNYGITILAILTKEGTVAMLDTYLMSCRVMGRGIEFAFMNHILGELQNFGITVLRTEYIPTPKNMPSQNFLSEASFAKVGEGVYEYDVHSYHPQKSDIRIEA